MWETNANIALKDERNFEVNKISLHGIIKQACLDYSNNLAIEDNYTNIRMTFAEFDAEAETLAAALQSFDIKKGDKISIFSENNGRWLVIDQAILRNGAVDAVRGSNAPLSELEYIVEQSDSVGVILKDATLYENLKEKLKRFNLKFVMIMFANGLNKDDATFPLYTYEEMIALGKGKAFEPVEVNYEDDATLIYTSGTTNKPKGVLLTHANLMSQPEKMHGVIDAQPNKTILCVLPIWHVYERGLEYFFFSHGTTFIYTNVMNVRSDMAKYCATFMIAVPRIWESICNNIKNSVKNKSKSFVKLFQFAISWSTINKKALRYIQRTNIYVKNYNIFGDIWNTAVYFSTLPLHKFFRKIFYKKLVRQFGIGFETSVSGGGSLAPTFVDFLEALEVNLIIGYGLTETSPVLTMGDVKHSIPYSAGKPIRDTEIKILSQETMQPLDVYEKGIVMVRGQQVMKGYYKDEKATAAVLSADGWFNTGDLGWITPDKNLVLTGREKEIIVLSNGENVEPSPIEQVCLESQYIDQIMLVGQDRSAIGALIVPTAMAYQQFGLSETPTAAEKERVHKMPEFVELFKKEINALMKAKSHFRPYERVAKFEFISEEFSAANGLLTLTAKMKRNNIAERYAKVIEKMY